MSNALSKWFAALLSVLLLYLLPAWEGARRQDDLSRLMVMQSVTKFTDSIRMKGYISPGVYNDFRKELGAAGNVYQVEMEHQHKRYHPEYSDPADPATFLGRYSVVHDAYYTSDIMQVLFPESELSSEADERLYKLTAGDYFSVEVSNMSTTPYQIYSNVLTTTDPSAGAGIAYVYGGMVLNEDY
ncbi:hypothetical protein [Paenibacillus lemnae]|uniref:Uncharacterized protein n=1 Tax=Paenibacillus lemnae TaxID=1330551 RepID=A0A848M6R5_PAELE|nr:hypothetical protein [Paenibacillus lemnae]NMO95949.1 hypothetical protein [Paenibacillus lemnae]